MGRAAALVGRVVDLAVRNLGLLVDRAFVLFAFVEGGHLGFLGAGLAKDCKLTVERGGSLGADRAGAGHWVEPLLFHLLFEPLRRVVR